MCPKGPPNRDNDYVVHRLRELSACTALTTSFNVNNRFGYYRGVLGGRYGISVRDAREAEKKLRIGHLLKTLDPECFVHFAEQAGYDSKVAPDITAYVPCIDSFEAFPLSEEEDNVLIYVAGCAQRILNRCPNADCNFKGSSYIVDLTKGGLTLPGVEVVEVLRYGASLLKAIMAAQSIRFLADSQQKNILADMVLWPLQDTYATSKGLCACSSRLAAFVANVLLNNMTKTLGQKRENEDTQKSSARKIAALTGR